MEWLLLGVIALAIWIVRTAIKDRAAASVLAKRIGFTPLNPFEGKQQDWFHGVVARHRVAICVVKLRTPHHPLRQSSRFLRVVMDVPVREALELRAVRHHLDSSSIHRFEEAFRVEGNALLQASTRDALLQFVRLGNPPQRYQFGKTPGPNARNLQLLRRASAGGMGIPANLMLDSRMLLIHDHPCLHLGADEFAGLVHQMSEVALAVESNASPPAVGSGSAGKSPVTVGVAEPILMAGSQDSHFDHAPTAPL